MRFMRNRLAKLLLAFSISFSLLISGSMVIHTPSAQAASVTAAKADKIIRTAQSYKGKVKYRYGTRDSKRLIFDCSSFTQFVFKKNGIDIPWGSSAQARVGAPVKNKAQLKKGDLVMFSVSKPGRINHVGIYIGSGKFIHNSPSSGVAISDLNSGFWKNKYITGRRL